MARMIREIQEMNEMEYINKRHFSYEMMHMWYIFRLIIFFLVSRFPPLFCLLSNISRLVVRFFFFIQAIFRSPCTPCHMASFFLSATSVTWHSLHSCQFCFLLSIFIEVKPLLTKVQLMYLDTWKHILHRYLFRFLHGMERFWQMKVKVRREEEGNFWTLYSLQEGMKAMGERGHGCSDEERRGQ